MVEGVEHYLRLDLGRGLRRERRRLLSGRCDLRLWLELNSEGLGLHGGLDVGYRLGLRNLHLSPDRSLCLRQQQRRWRRRRRRRHRSHSSVSDDRGGGKSLHVNLRGQDGTLGEGLPCGGGVVVDQGVGLHRRLWWWRRRRRTHG